jgi:hypothetical protein
MFRRLRGVPSAVTSGKYDPLQRRIMATRFDATDDADLGLTFDRCDVFSRLIIVLMPLVLLAVNVNWIFSEPIFVDRWFYSGFHLHLPLLQSAFGDTYYASRLPWTVIGWLLHSALGDERALYVLHFAVFYLAVFSLYAAIRTIFASSSAAGVAAVLLGTNSFFLVAAGWDYVSGPLMACSLASIAAMAGTAISRRWRVAAFLWGIAACSMVSMYLSMVLFVPIQVGMFLFLNRLRGKRSVVLAAVWTSAGGLAAMLFMGLINWVSGGPFLYILNQIRVVGSVTAGRFEYVLPSFDWIWLAVWLLVPAITFAFSCVFVAFHARSAWKSLRLVDVGADLTVFLFVCCTADIAASLIYVGLEALRFPALEIHFFANALFPFAYLTIGGALAIATKQANQIRQLWFIVGAVTVAFLPWLLATSGHIFPNMDLFTGAILGSSWVVAGAFLISSLVRKSYWPLTGSMLLVLFVSIINLGAPTTQIDYPPNPAFKQQTLAVFDASRQLRRYNVGARAHFWFDDSDPSATLLRDVAATYLYTSNLVNQNVPRLVAADPVIPGERVILLTSKGDDPVALANLAAADQFLSFEQVARIDTHRPGVAFTSFVADVKVDQSKYEEIAASQPFAMRLPSRIVTPPQRFGYGTQIPLQTQDLEGPLWIRIQASVHAGPFGIGILNQDGSDFLCRTSVSDIGDTIVSLLVPKSRQLGDLVIQSWSAGKAADVTINGITVLKPRSVRSSSDIPTDAEEITDAFGPSSVGGLNSSQNAFPAEVDAPALPWAYAARFPLKKQDLKGPLWIRLHGYVHGGPIGVGVLNQSGSDFLSRSEVFASDNAMVILRVAKPELIGDLVIETWVEGNPGHVRVDTVTVLKPHRPSAKQP